MTMDGNDGDGPAGPPDGLLAQAVAASQAAPEKKAEDPTGTAPVRTTASVDPNYTEPVTVIEYRKEVAVMFPQDGPDAPNDCGVPMDSLKIQALFYAMCVRIEKLEAAIKPFATKAAIMANVQMCLASQGRSNEPSGGTWIHAISHSQLSGDENIFFDACDAYGRERTEKEMIETFSRLTAMQAAAVEAQKHIDDGGKLH